MEAEEETPQKRIRTQEHHAAMSACRPPVMPPASASEEQPSSLPSPNTLDPKFVEELSSKHNVLCHVLNLDADTKAKTGMVFQSFLNAIRPEDYADLVMNANAYLSISIWAACAIINEIQRQQEGNLYSVGVSLSQVINAVKITPNEFFRKVPILLSRCPVITETEQKHFLEVEAKKKGQEIHALDQMSIRMKELFNSLTICPSSDPFSRKVEEEFVSESLKLCWLLFLFSTEFLITAERKTLENYYIILICSIRFILKHFPVSMMRSTADVMNKFNISADSASGINVETPWKSNMDFIFFSFLKAKCSLTLDQYLEHEKEFVSMVHSELVQTGSWICTGFTNGFVENVFVLNNMNGVRYNVDATSKAYQALHKQSGSIDGRYFIEKTMTSFTPRKIGRTPSAVQKNGRMQAKIVAQKLRQACALSLSMVSTPLTAKGMCGKRQSRPEEDNNVLGEFIMVQCKLHPHDRLTASLDGLFKQLNPNPSDMVMSRCRAVYEELVKTVPIDGNKIAVSISYYLRTLEIMLVAESKNGSISGLSSLMNDANFHSSILYISFEIISCTLKFKHLTTEYLAKYLSISVFDLAMVIEIVIGYQGQNLNRNLIKRLKEIEERVLESEVWKKDDPLYKFLEKEHDEGLKNSARNALHFVNQSPQQFQAGECHVKIHSECNTNLEIFFRKLYRLLYSRLLSINQAIGNQSSIIDKSWNVLVDALIEEVSRKLFYQRHIDQLILCTIYGVSRGNDITLSMNDIVQHYTKQPQANVDIVYNITIESAKDAPENSEVPQKGSIIDFYNYDFTSKTKDLIWKTINKTSDTQDAYPVPMSPLPMNKRLLSINRPMATPRSKKLFNPGEEGIQSSSPRAPPSATKRKVLNFNRN